MNMSTSQVHGPPEHGFVAGRRLTKVIGLEHVKCNASKPAACSRSTQHYKKNALRHIFSCQQRLYASGVIVSFDSKSTKGRVNIEGTRTANVYSSETHSVETQSTGNSAASDNSAICHRLTRYYDNAMRHKSRHQLRFVCVFLSANL